MLPTAAGDPLLAGLPLPHGLDQIVLSHTAAEKLAARPGDWLETRFARQVAGRVEAQRTRLQVLAVLPLEAFAREGLFADLALLEAAEDYRDGRAVPALSWAGDAASVSEQRIYPAFRLYARSLSDVEPLRVYFAGQNLLVSTQAHTIAQVQSLSRNLSIVFWIIAGLALAGAFAAIFAGTLAAVARKHRELSVLRLLGFSTAALLLFVLLQALYSAGFAAVLSVGLYGLAEAALNKLLCRCRASTPATCWRAITAWPWWRCSASVPWRPPVVVGGWHVSRLLKESEMYKLLGACVALSLASLAGADEASDKLDNPKPLPDDVSLPLPCEGNMVFRYAYILAQGTLDDREINLGYPLPKARRVISSRLFPATAATSSTASSPSRTCPKTGARSSRRRCRRPTQNSAQADAVLHRQVRSDRPPIRPGDGPGAIPGQR